MIGGWGGRGTPVYYEYVPLLRKVPPFVTALTFCASWDGLRNSGFLRTVPTNADIFARFMTMPPGKAGCRKDFWHPKRKLGLTTHFSEIIWKDYNNLG